jgi:branched-chain amino acid aminotransferase
LEEAGTMNVFFRINDTLLTAPVNDSILDGVTRKSVIEVAKSKGIAVDIRPVEVSEILEAQKNWSPQRNFWLWNRGCGQPH